MAPACPKDENSFFVKVTDLRSCGGSARSPCTACVKCEVPIPLFSGRIVAVPVKNNDLWLQPKKIYRWSR